MKVLFLISNLGHGKGGHFHSLHHISTALGEKIEVGICTVGPGKSSVLESNKHFISRIDFNGLNVIKFYRDLNSVIKSFRPLIVHCFDVKVFDFYSLFFRYKEIKIIVSKCGGPDFFDFPVVSNLILFSEENKKWFDARSKFKATDIRVIPNRIHPDLIFFDNKHKVLKQNRFCFIRIARIGSTYRKSIEDSIRLIKKLVNEKGLKVYLYLVGTVEDKQIEREIREKIKGLPVSILTANEYTAKASDMLDLGDAVIATGRGIMEAARLGKPLLTPVSNSDLPVLVDESNFGDFFCTNFSQRNYAVDSSLAYNFVNIVRLITDAGYYNRVGRYSKELFDEHFSITEGVDKYLDFYREVILKGGKGEVFLKNLKLKIRSWLLLIRDTKQL